MFCRPEPIVSNSVGPFLSVGIRWTKVIQSFLNWYKKTDRRENWAPEVIYRSINLWMYQEGYFTCYFWCGNSSHPPMIFLGDEKNLWFWMRISAVLDLLPSPCSEMLELVQITILEEDVSIPWADTFI